MTPPRSADESSAQHERLKPLNRCAAINADPDTAARDLAIPQALMRRLGHTECGIYAEVIAGGTIATGDTIAAEEPEQL